MCAELRAWLQRPETPEALAKAFDVRLMRPANTLADVSRLQDGLTAVRRYGGAGKGYRTMLDALLPASEALQSELKAGARESGESTCGSTSLNCMAFPEQARMEWMRYSRR